MTSDQLNIYSCPAFEQLQNTVNEPDDSVVEVVVKLFNCALQPESNLAAAETLSRARPLVEATLTEATWGGFKDGRTRLLRDAANEIWPE